MPPIESEQAMGLGSAVRHRLGRFEVPAADLYRSRFINLDDLASTLASLAKPRRILEIGCGDGTLADRLCAAFPEAEYVGIDVASTAGRLFSGDRSRATFRSITSTDLLAEGPEPFDLVAIVDVVHHVPVGLRHQILRDAAALLSPDGLIALKEWERGRGLAHMLAFTADRYLSGDSNVSFMTPDELATLVRTSLPEFETFCEARIPPRRNNLLLALRRAARPL